MAIAKKGPDGVITTGPVVGKTQLGQDITVQAVKNTQGADAQAWFASEAKRAADAAEAEKNRLASIKPEKIGAYTSADGVYHPETYTQVPTAPTIGQVYSQTTKSSSTGNPELDAAYAAYGAQIQGTQGPIDEEAIRRNTMDKFQAEIDALNRYFAEQKSSRFASEDKLGQQRLGTGAAIQARRGLIGSDFGAAQTDKINQGTEENKRAIGATIEAERLAQVQDILGQARTMSDKEIADKEAARKQGSADYIKFLEDAATRKEQNTQTTIASLLQTGIEPDDGTVKSLAQQLGISEKDFREKFTSTKKAATEQAAKTAAENAPKPIIVDGTAYQVQADGTYKAVTPEKTEKPIIIGGQGYEKQADGTYKAVITAEAKPITKTVGKVLYQSLDGGKTWQNALTGKTNTTIVSTKKSSAPSATATAAAAEKAMTKELSKLAGPDSFITPDAYSQAKNAWTEQGYSATSFDTKFKGLRNPANPNYQVGK